MRKLSVAEQGVGRFGPLERDRLAEKAAEVLGYLSKAHAERWGRGIRAFFESGRVVCREAGLHQRTFKSGNRTFYLSVDMTDEEWLEQQASR